MPTTKYPAHVCRLASTWNKDATALYWTVSHRSIRYWVGPAQGPAAHVHEAQARRLASTLNAQDRRLAQRTIRHTPA